MEPTHSPSTSRVNARDRFLSAHGYGQVTLQPLRQDASTRQYFRFESGGTKRLLMDAPPATEKPGEFYRITAYLEDLGARVPGLVAADIEQGFLVLEDLGDQTFTQLLACNIAEEELYGKALDELLGIQNRFPDLAHGISLPGYDFDATLTELRLFTDWYLPARIGRRLSGPEQSRHEEIWHQLYIARPPLSDVVVHRDYHVDNLLMVDGRCAMLDYQDALLGSPLYDLVSLLEDARRDVSPSLRTALIRQWRNGQDTAGSISDQDFWYEYRFWAAQRHCKVAGIFIRLWLRDNKDTYLQHLPRVLSLLASNLGDPGMTPLRQWILDYLPEISHAPIGPQADFLADANEFGAA